MKNRCVPFFLQEILTEQEAERRACIEENIEQDKLVVGQPRLASSVRSIVHVLAATSPPPYEAMRWVRRRLGQYS